MTELEKAARQAAEDVSKAYDLIAWGHTERAAEILKDARTALRQALADNALDKMAENERELGIQMQPTDDFQERLAKAIEAMPFGDTAASFAAFVRGFK